MRPLVMGDFQSEVTKSEKSAKSKKSENVLVDILAKWWIQDFYASLESSHKAHYNNKGL